MQELEKLIRANIMTFAVVVVVSWLNWLCYGTVAVGVAHITVVSVIVIGVILSIFTGDVRLVVVALVYSFTFILGVIALEYQDFSIEIVFFFLGISVVFAAACSLRNELKLRETRSVVFATLVPVIGAIIGGAILLYRWLRNETDYYTGF